MAIIAHNCIMQDIYTGVLQTIEFEIEDFTSGKIKLDLEYIIENSNRCLSALSIEQLKVVCKSSRVIATIYPNGNCGLMKFNSQNEPVRTCYLVNAENNNGEFCVLIAMDEQQPMIYRVQYLGAFTITQ